MLIITNNRSFYLHGTVLQWPIVFTDMISQRRKQLFMVICPVTPNAGSLNMVEECRNDVKYCQ